MYKYKNHIILTSNLHHDQKVVAISPARLELLARAKTVTTSDSTLIPTSVPGIKKRNNQQTIIPEQYNEACVVKPYFAKSYNQINCINHKGITI